MFATNTAIVLKHNNIFIVYITISLMSLVYYNASNKLCP